MTPKEKAKELVDKLNDHIEMVSDYRYELEFAKKRAIICVEEILNDILNPLVYEAESKFYLYWEDVRNELSLL